jgi:hypothetical protein
MSSSVWRTRFAWKLMEVVIVLAIQNFPVLFCWHGNNSPSDLLPQDVVTMSVTYTIWRCTAYLRDLIRGLDFRGEESERICFPKISFFNGWTICFSSLEINRRISFDNSVSQTYKKILVIRNCSTHISPLLEHLNTFEPNSLQTFKFRPHVFWEMAVF